MKKIKLILGGIGSLAIVATIPAVAVACSSDTNDAASAKKALETDIANYVTKLNGIDNLLSTNTNAINELPSDVTSNNVTKFINTSNVPATPTGLTINYVISNKNNNDGTLDVSIEVSATGVSSSTTAVSKLKGFQTNQIFAQNYVDSLDTKIKANKIQINELGKKTTATPQAINSNNLNNYLEGVSTISNNFTQSFTDLSWGLASGVVSFKISISGNGIKPITSNTITINGFATMQSVIDSYIAEINKAHLELNVKGKTLVSTAITSNNIQKYVTNIPEIPAGLQVLFKVTQGENNSISFTATASQIPEYLTSSTTEPKTSNSFTISGFVNSDNAINDFSNLKANNAFGAPIVNTTPVDFSNAAAIFTSFNLSQSQINNLKSIKDLKISVTSSNAAEGTATLKFEEGSNSKSFNYSGFFKWTEANKLNASIESYFKNNDNVASWLNDYLSINPNWINTFLSKTTSYNFLWNYYSYSSGWSVDNFQVKNINNVITITCKTINDTTTPGGAVKTGQIVWREWDSSANTWGNAFRTMENTPISFGLPYLFQNTSSDGGFPFSITTDAQGKTTLSWKTSAINNSKFYFKVGVRFSTQFRLDTGSTTMGDITF